MELKACCKINLGLRVLRRRPDGFHEIETAMIALRGLSDTVSVRSSMFVPATPPPYFAPPEVTVKSALETTGEALDCSEEANICMRALRLLQHEFGVGEAIVRLHKCVPSGAGLGGGSSDAAATLIAGNQEFMLELSEREMEKLALELGSDVAFFVRALQPKAPPLSAHICTGRGEMMMPVELDLRGKWLAILKPADVNVSTAQAYSEVVAREQKTSLSELLKRPIEEWKTLIVNDFEETVFARHPKIAALKSELYQAGALYASMSGSGSAVFGIFDARPKIFDEKSTLGEARKHTFLHIERL